MEAWKGKKLSLEKLCHRVKMVKSASFMKLVLVQDNHGALNDERQYQKTLKYFGNSTEDFFQRKRQERKYTAFGRIKQAGWKLIVEVESSKEESEVPFEEGTFEKVQSNETTMLPTDRTFVTGQSSFPTDIPTISFIQEKQNYQVNGPSSHTFRRQRSSRSGSSKTEYRSMMRKKKRAIILQKLQNLQLCSDYLHHRNQRDLYCLGRQIFQ